MMLVSINNPLPLSRGILCTYSIKIQLLIELPTATISFQP
jgi:hypothetical protein